VKKEERPIPSTLAERSSVIGEVFTPKNEMQSIFEAPEDEQTLESRLWRKSYGSK